MNNQILFDKFETRHIGPRDYDIQKMIETIGVDSLDKLIDETIPENIRLSGDDKSEPALTESQFLNHLKDLSKKNKVYQSFIGMGYYSTILPPVIQRNILENPGWYTQYTPYQAEISQGRLEALLNFQTMISDLTGLPISNASLLDEATAASEAMIMLKSQRSSKKKNSNVIFISDEVFPQTIDVIKTRAFPQGVEVRVGCHYDFDFSDDVFAIVLQYPSVKGTVYDYRKFIKNAKEKGIFIIMAADLMSLALLVPPGEMDVDVAVGSTQRFGIPLGFGGPHAAYFATKDEFKRVIPGRIIGVSIDSNNERALRMALQTREQHIRREKATSNICTSQVLLAIMAGMYAIYHGPDGIKNIASRIHKFTCLLDKKLQQLGYIQLNKNYFDTLQIDFDNESVKRNFIETLALDEKINFNYFYDDKILISIDEKTTLENIEIIVRLFAKAKATSMKVTSDEIEHLIGIGSEFIRESSYLLHPVFNSYHSEHEMLRYIKRLESKDLSLTTSMIPLGSCTMKLNAASEMFGVSWSEFSDIHPFVPVYQSAGYMELINELEKDLCRLTGFEAVSMQPNSGAQGEYAGLMVIRNYLRDIGQPHRDVMLIPASAHGTNPASAVMAGMKVIVVNCDSKGNIDINDLEQKATKFSSNLAGIMVTYPSTHGVFESNITEICEIIHKNNGQVYMDGANMNAQVGLTSPAKIGADVCHINLHKTFSIPHGGGGPGMGPIAVAKHLVPYLPSHPVVNISKDKSMTAVSAAPYGSAGILMISYGYIKMMGFEGLKNATKVAILNANYIIARLEKYYKVLFVGDKARVGHEMIFDMREFKNSAGIEVEDIAKRLMDYGFHAPTVSFPVPGTLMIEPTESESKEELDRFCDALISIRSEIQEIIDKKSDRTDNVLKNAPHTARMVTSDNWNHCYSREKAAYPNAWTKFFKFWPGVGRINNAHGDRNLVCTCEPIESYIQNK